MTGSPDTQSAARKWVEPEAAVALSGWAVMTVAYALMFSIFGQGPILGSLGRGLINVVPAALLAWPVALLIQKRLATGPLALLLVGHIVLGLGFAVLWYMGVQIGYGFRSGWAGEGIVGRPLIGVALAWQAFQGLTLYAAVAGFAYAALFRRRWLELKDRPSAPTERIPEARTLLVKDGKTIRPVGLDDILLVSAAGDYAEIVARHGRYMSSTALGLLEADLADRGFLRVHRSHMVRLDAILSVESAGNGRLTLHLPGGESVTTSRSGAARFRDRAV